MKDKCEMSMSGNHHFIDKYLTVLTEDGLKKYGVCDYCHLVDDTKEFPGVPAELLNKMKLTQGLPTGIVK